MQKNQVKHFPIFIKKPFNTDIFQKIHYGIKNSLNHVALKKAVIVKKSH